MGTRNLQHRILTGDNGNRRGVTNEMIRKHKRERNIAIAVVFAVEMAFSFVVTTIAGVFLVPAVSNERGYFAIGGEWIVLLLIANVSYMLIHNYLFDAAKRWTGGKKIERTENACRKISGSAHSAEAFRDGAARSTAKARMDYQQRGRC